MKHEKLQKHPYKEYENHPAWDVLEKIIYELEENQDLIQNTRIEYIIGYTLKNLDANGLLKND